MRSAWFRRLGLAAVASAAIFGSSATIGCAGTRDDVNRVQPNAMRKNDLVGDFRNPKGAPDFYMRSLITEVQRTNPWVSDGLQDLTRRVRFEITEGYLIARNAFEYIKGSDGKGGAAGHINNGSVVGMWPIKSHFNVQRSYNPATGEDTNVIEENSSDVPWYEREYMRVDWSANRVTDPNEIFSRDDGEMHLTPVSYFENRPGRPDRSNFEEINTGYFDLTSKWLFKPATFDYYGYQVPYCLLKNMSLYPSTYSEGSIECNDQEITLRTAFWKVPTGADSTDYEVGEVSSWEGNVMGNLLLDRSGYDREYGVTDTNWHRYLMRYNIWQKSHSAEVCGTDNKKVDADAHCAAVKTDSTCDLNAKLCTVPYSERTVRPLAFYLDPEMPPALEPATKRAIGEWNTALSRAVAYAREIECRHTGQPRDACHLKHFAGPVDPKQEDVPKLADGDVVIMCHNPVIDGDNKACGQKGFTTRKGDIRHHMIAWWNNPSFNRPLGVIVWSGDPTTGENIGSTVNIFGASVETYSASARDQLQLISGDFTPAEYAAGLPRQIYSTQNLSYSTDPITDPVLDSYATHLESGAKPAMGAAEIAARLKAVDVAKIQKEYGADKALIGANTPIEKMTAWANYVKKQSALGESGSHFADPKVYLDKLNRKMEAAQKGGLETKVVNDIWTSSLGIDPKLAGDKIVLDGVSPLRGMNPTQLVMAAEAEVAKQRAKHQCTLQAGPEMLSFNWQAGYAAKMKARYPNGAVATGEMAKRAGVEGQAIDRVVRGKLIYQELLEPMYEFTLLHEMGHLMSMEHDFSGSWDSPNFYPEYWTLRTNAGKASKACTVARAPGAADDCMGPRWLDPVTTDEIGTTPGKEHDSLDAYAVSSVMDYKFDSLYAAKLGLMDKMAAKFIYTRTIELFDDDDKSLIKGSRATGNKYIPTLTLMNSERWIVGQNYAHYTDMGRQLNLFDANRCRPQTKEEADHGIGALGLTCAPPHKDHAFLKDMRDALPAGFPEFFRVQLAREKSTAEGGFTDAAATKTRWPYKVGDGHLSYVHQYYYDNGADFFEVTTDILERYQLMYLDYFFRKGGRERNIARAGQSMFGRFFARVQALQWNALSDVVRNGGGIDGGGDPEGQARVLSLTMLFDAMQAAFLRPQPGSYVQDKQTGSMNPIFVSISDEANKNSPAFNLGAGDARYIDHKYDLTKQFDYQAYAFRAGSYLEKPYAGIALTDARPQLSTVARETYLDGRNVMFSFRSAIPQAFDRLVAGVFADDWDTIAPFIDPSSKADKFGMSPMSTVKLWDSDAAKLAAARPVGSKVVDPMLGYRVKVPAVVMMLLYQPIDSSMELVNKTRVWVAGSTEAIKVPDAEKMTFFDPVDGVEWNAKSFGKEKLTGKTVDTGIGARMLEHANELLVSAYNVETEVVDATTGQKRAKYGPDGRAMRVGGGSLTPADVKDAAAEKKLRDYVAFLNQVRIALNYLGFGPCGFTYDRDC